MDILDWTQSVLEESNRALDRSAHDESLRLLDEALGRLAEIEASLEVRAEAQALLLRNRGRTWRVKGEPRRALADYDAVAERLVPLQSPARPDLAFVLARLHNNRANALSDLGDADGAIVALGVAIDVLPPSDPEHPEWDSERALFVSNRASARLNRGDVCFHLGRLAEALADYERSLAASEGLRATLEPLGQWTPKLRMDLLAAYLGRANALCSQGRPEEAVSAYDQAITAGEGLRALLEPGTNWSIEVRNALTSEPIAKLPVAVEPKPGEGRELLFLAPCSVR